MYAYFYGSFYKDGICPHCYVPYLPFLSFAFFFSLCFVFFALDCFYHCFCLPAYLPASFFSFVPLSFCFLSFSLSLSFSFLSLFLSLLLSFSFFLSLFSLFLSLSLSFSFFFFSLFLFLSLFLSLSFSQISPKFDPIIRKPKSRVAGSDPNFGNLAGTRYGKSRQNVGVLRTARRSLCRGEKTNTSTTIRRKHYDSAGIPLQRLTNAWQVRPRSHTDF